MTQISKIILGVFLGFILVSTIVAFNRYILEGDYVIFYSETDIPDPFSILN